MEKFQVLGDMEPAVLSQVHLHPRWAHLWNIEKRLVLTNCVTNCDLSCSSHAVRHRPHGIPLPAVIGLGPRTPPKPRGFGKKPDRSRDRSGEGVAKQTATRVGFATAVSPYVLIKDLKGPQIINV